MYNDDTRMLMMIITCSHSSRNAQFVIAIKETFAHGLSFRAPTTALPIPGWIRMTKIMRMIDAPHSLSVYVIYGR